MTAGFFRHTMHTRSAKIKQQMMLAEASQKVSGKCCWSHGRAKNNAGYLVQGGTGSDYNEAVKHLSTQAPRHELQWRCELSWW